jgi:hypothetical protein
MKVLKSRVFYALCGAMAAVSLVAQLSAAAAQDKKTSGGGVASITPVELKEWLSYIASDQLQGRQVYTEGLGLAASYIADHLKEWGVKRLATKAATFRS